MGRVQAFGVTTAGLVLLTAMMGQQPKPPAGIPSSPGANAAAMTPSELLTRLNANNQIMIKAGRLAEQRGATAVVRRYGNRIAHDHTVADHLVRQEAFRAGMNLQSATPTASPNPLPALRNVQGAGFDRQFLTMMKQQDQTMVLMLSGAETSVRQAPSAPMTALIDKVLPLARIHLLLTQALLQPGATI